MVFEYITIEKTTQKKMFGLPELVRKIRWDLES